LAPEFADTVRLRQPLRQTDDLLGIVFLSSMEGQTSPGPLSRGALVVDLSPSSRALAPTPKFFWDFTGHAGNFGKFAAIYSQLRYVRLSLCMNEVALAVLRRLRPVTSAWRAIWQGGGCALMMRWSPPAD
jgi:hypothetical protein